MPYTINKTNGLKITVVQDGTINTSALDIILVGKNYIGYGESFNENFVKLLENFANSTKPAKPLAGQLWYDTSINRLNVYTGAGSAPWKPLGIVNNGTTQPVTATSNVGDLWWDAINKKLFAYNGTEWTIIGPSVVKGSNSGAFSGTILSQSGPPAKSVVFQSIDGAPAFVSSTAPLYSTDSSDLSASLFPRVYTGITFPNTDNRGISITDLSIQNQPKGYMLWGTAASSLGLIVASTATSGFSFVDANNFLLRNELASFSNQLNLKDNNGVILGNPFAMQLHIAPANVGNVSVFAGSKLNLNVNTSYGTYTTVVSADGTNDILSLLPNPTIPTNIGSVSESFANGYFGTIVANTLTVKTFLYEQQELDASYISATRLSVGTSVTAAVFAGSGANLTNIPITALTANSVNVTAGTGLNGGGTISLGGSVTLSNAGVLSVKADTGADITASTTNGIVTISNIGTLQTITSRGASSSNIIRFTNSTNATNATSGALQITGGTGIAKDLYVGGAVTSQSLSAGAATITGSATIGQTLSVTGAATITGGATIGQSGDPKDLSVSGSVYIAGNKVFTNISGTTDQINVTFASSSPILSLPQNIAVNSAVTFGSVTTPTLTAGSPNSPGTITGQWTVGADSSISGITPTVVFDGEIPINVTTTFYVTNNKLTMLFMYMANGQSGNSFLYSGIKWGMGGLTNDRLFYTAAVDYQVAESGSILTTLPAGSGTTLQLQPYGSVNGQYGVLSTARCLVMQF